MKRIIKERHKHVSREYCELMMEVIDPLGSIIWCVSNLNCFHHGRKVFKDNHRYIFQNQTETETFQRFTYFEKGTYFVFAKGTAIVTHNGDQCINAALAPVIADIYTLARLNLNKSQFLKLNKTCIDNGTRYTHFGR